MIPLLLLLSQAVEAPDLGPVIEIAPGSKSHQTFCQGRLDEEGFAVVTWHEAQNVKARLVDLATGELGPIIPLSQGMGKQVDECRLAYDPVSNHGTVVSSWRYGVGNKESMDSMAWTFHVAPAPDGDGLTHAFIWDEGPFSLSPEVTTSSWRPLVEFLPLRSWDPAWGPKPPKGTILWLAVQTEEWNEESVRTVYDSDGNIWHRGLLHAPNGGSQNWPHALTPDHETWRDGNTKIIFEGAVIGLGWQQRALRDGVIWESLDHRLIYFAPYAPGSDLQILGMGRDADGSGPWKVWERMPWMGNGESFIEGVRPGDTAPIRLTPDLAQGNLPFGELDRRTPDIEWLRKPGGGVVGVLFFSGFVSPNGPRRAMARVIEGAK